MRYSLAFIGLAAAILCLAEAASQVDSIDEQVAQGEFSSVCEPAAHKARLLHLATIPSLLQHFKQQQVDHPSATCRKRWLRPLRRLQQVLESGSRDACSAETVDKIEEFHWRYIVGSLSQAWRQASSTLRLPEPLRVFFLQLAESIARKCRSTLGERTREAVKLSSTVAADGALDSAQFKRNFGLKIKTLSLALVASEKVKRFGDFFLFLDSIVANERKKGYSTLQQVDPATGEHIYMSLKVQDPSGAHQMQHDCRHHLRPIYANTVLPVMRLIDMGFMGGERDERLQDELVRQLYGVTQFCQLLLPIKFYSGHGLKRGQVLIVGDDEDAERMSHEGVEIAQLPANIRASPAVVVEDLTGNEAENIVKQVKANMKTRGQIHRKTLKNMLAKASGSLKSKLKSIFMRKPSDELDEADLSRTIARAEADLERQEQQDQQLDAVTRRKRDDDDEMATTTPIPVTTTTTESYYAGEEHQEDCDKTGLKKKEDDDEDEDDWCESCRKWKSLKRGLGWLYMIVFVIVCVVAVVTIIVHSG